MNEMRIWVGCLHCYNSGRLVGEWFDVEATDESEITLAAVHAHGTLTASCEELWVMDHEGFAGLIEGEGSPIDFYEAKGVLDSILSELYDPEPDDVPAVVERLQEEFGRDFRDWTVDSDTVGFTRYDSWRDAAMEDFEEFFGSVHVHDPYTYRNERKSIFEILPDWLSIDWNHSGEQLSWQTEHYVERGGYVYIFNTI